MYSRLQVTDTSVMGNMDKNKPLADNTKKNNLEDFDDILQKVGGWGLFQYILVIAFFPFSIFLGYIYLSPILTLFTPPHWCKIPELMNLTREERKLLAIPKIDGEYSQCSQYLVDWNQTKPDWLLNHNVTRLIGDCQSGWEYELEDYHTSITVQLNWVCGKAWIPALSQLLFFMGAIPGILFFGWFSDSFGRLPTIIFSNLIAGIVGVLTPFVTSQTQFLILRFTMGLAFNTFFTAPYILVMEYVDTSKRTLVGNLGLALCLTLSGMYQPWTMKYLGDWKVFNWIMFSQIGLVVFAPLVLPESARWLMVKGKDDKLLSILRHIAKLNKKQLSEKFTDEVRLLCKKQKEIIKSKPSYSYMDLFRNKHMRKITLLSIPLWMIISLVFDTTVRNVSNIKLNFYISFMVATAMELPADLLSIAGLNWLGRRWSSCIPMFFCGITMIACVWLKGDAQAQGAMFILGRVFATYCINVGFQFTVEVMPTDLRGQGTALVNVMSMVSQMASPYIVYSAVMSENAPFLLIGSIAFLGSLPGLFLPETAGVDLPDSLKDIEEFGRRDRFFWMPLCGSSSRYKSSKEDIIVATGNENKAFTS